MRSDATVALCALLALLVGGGDAQEDPVCEPDSWEGLIMGKLATMSEKTGKVSLYDLYQQYSFDAANSRSYAYQVLHLAGTPAEDLVMQVYERPNEGIRYVALPKYKHCTKEPSQFYFSPQCLPGDAKYLGRYVQAGLAVDLYQYQLAGGVADFVSAYTPSTNILVNNMGTTSYGGEHTFGAQSIVNVTIGIRDPSIFILPTYCSTAASGPTQSLKALADYF